MTPPNSPPESDTQSPQKQTQKRAWLGSAFAIFGVSLLGLGVAGYFGLDYFIRRKLPTLLNKQVSEFINREVKIGEIKSWSLTGVRLENASIPAFGDDPNYVKAKAIDIGFNPLGLLLTRTLPLRITVIEPDVYVEEDKQGEWVRVNLDTQPEGELPFDIDAKVNLRRAEVVVLPQFLKTPFAVEQINGFLNYNQKSPWLRYGIDASVVKGKVEIDGETKLESWKSKITAKIDKLSLADLSGYVKDKIPVRIPRGELNTNLEIDLPSLSELPSVRGFANVEGLQIKSPQLKVPLNAIANLKFAGKKVSFEKTKGSYGGLIAAVSGDVDLDKGFNLKVDTNSFGIGKLIKTTSFKSPVNIDGNLQAQFLVKGNIDNPILLGNVLGGGVKVEKTVFSKVNTVFGGNLQQIVLQEFRATPATGGDIIAKGKVSFPKSLPEVKDFSKSKLALAFDAEFPNTGMIVAPYGVTEDMVKLGRLSADGEVSGTIANPQGLLSWKLPQAEANVVGQVSGGGEVKLSGNLVTLNNTSLRTDSAKVDIDGGANLARSNWNVAVNADGINVNPFLAKVENVGERLQETPIFLRRADVQLAGSLKNFDPGTIQGDVDLNLNVNKGNVAVNGKLNRGILSANANAGGIGLNKILPELPLEVAIANTKVKLSGRVKELLEFKSINSLESFRAKVDGNLILPKLKGKGRVNFNGEGNFATKNWNLIANLNSLPINSLLSDEQRKQFRLNQPVNLRRGNVRLAGNLDIINDFDPTQVRGSANLNLNVNNGSVLVNGNLNRGILQANVSANGISANPFLPELPLPVTVANTQVNLSGRVQQLLEFESIEKLDKLNSFRAIANGQLIIPRSRGKINFNVNGDLVSNNLQAVARVNQLRLHQLLPDSPLPVTANNTKVNLTGKIDQLVANNFDNLKADVNTNLAIAKGTVNTIANLNDGKIASNIIARNLNTNELCRNFDLSCPPLDKLSAKFNLSGEIKPPLEGNPILIQANQADITTQGQKINSKGQIVIVPGDEEISSWNIASDLNVKVNSNLAKLPLQSIAQQLDIETIPLQGKADFSGRLVARNLISEPLAPGNVRLVGNLNLKNLALDKIAFQPLLQGPVNVNLGNSIELDLRGKTDRIAANLQPCTRSDCLSPYLPTFFDFQQGVNTVNSILLTGKRQGDVLDIELKNASLSLLNLLPIVQETIGTTVGGTITGNLDVNLFNLATAGNINVDYPSIGALKAEKFIADFSYDGEIARVNAANLQIGKTRYALLGGFNLNSGDINGKLVADSARVQDIFTAVNVFNLKDLQRGINGILNPDYVNAADIQTQAVGKPNSTILQQLRLFAEITRRIQQQAALKQEEADLQFDIKGEYNAELAVAGKLTNPQINFQLQGNNWQWRPLQEYVTVNPRQGVVVQQNPAINIDKVVAQASYQNGIIQIEPVQLGVEGGLIALGGKLHGFQTSGFLQIQNFPVELVERFVEFPLDVTGKVNLQAKIGGNLFQPEIPQGAFSFTNGSINKKPLGEFAGFFNYIDSIAKLNTTPDSIVKIDATVPYPPQLDKNNGVAVEAKIDSKAFPLLTPLTRGELEWVEGNGEIALLIDGALNPKATKIEELLNDLKATSTIGIENAKIKTKQLDSEIKFTANGNLALNNRRIKIEQLSGHLAESPFIIAGSLPLFQPIGGLEPLNIALGPGDMKLKGLYNGEIDANVKISRTIQNPVIGGEVLLQKGKVSIPKIKEEKADNTEKIKNQLRKLSNNQIPTTPQKTNNLPIQPTFKDFQVTIGKGFGFSQILPRINFRIAGDLTINGTYPNLRGNGEIELRKGNLFILNNSFFVTRAREQTVTFSPNRSLLNPQLDIEVQTTVTQAPNFDRLQPQGSEIREDIVASANPEQIDIAINLKGEADKLLASLNNNASSGDACQAFQTNILLSGLGTSTTNSSNQLKKVAQCINANSKVSIQTKDILENPAITLTSTPTRSETEILSLLGNRTFAAIQKLEQEARSGNETELLESLVLDYVIAPLQTEITQDFLWQVQRPVNSFGKSIGLRRLQVFPSLTGLKDFNQNSSARFIYDYEAGEFRLMYERRF